ncbi:MBL fold metallo-hydrolase [Desulfobacula sp.]|uniref:MBL fold metallo-hydrolase n=1 Tax=Desulfobacula sp. TaxID=2593537 RepID=UPI00261ECCD4|nr:MBL fold metallo-hydrolase [Desulfobacula sp.]
MKLTVLIDNNTLIDRYFLGEPGVSYLIEDEGKKILFDVGYSDAFIKNARKISIDLLDVDFVALSHGHLDHSWGLIPLIRLYTEGMIENLQAKKPTLVTHPLALSSRRIGDLPEIGSLLPEDKLSGYFNMELSREPVNLTERLVFLGEIEQTNEFEAKTPIGRIMDNKIEKDDFIVDDSALAYKSSAGLVIITGCSHAGICNIVEYARKVCKDERVVDIVGGFHLLDPSDEQLEGTVRYMESLCPGSVHACHCTDLKSKIALSKVVDLKEVGVGMMLKY